MVLANNLFQLALSDLPSPYLSGDYLAAQRVQVVQRRIHPYRVLLAEKAHDAFLAPYLYAGLTRTFDDRRQLLGDQAVHLLPLADAPHDAQQVHVFGKGDTFHIKRHLAVREYLRPHPTVCAEYGELKRRLASRTTSRHIATGKTFMRQLGQEALRFYLRPESEEDAQKQPDKSTR